MGIGVLLLLFLFGCLGGLLSGILGLGAGMVFILIFTTYLTSKQVPDQVIAQLVLANSMFVVFFSGLSGSIKQHLNQNFFLKPVLAIGISSMLTSVSVTYLINKTSWYNRDVFTIVFILVMGYIAYQFFFLKEEVPNTAHERSSLTDFILIGAIGGIILALAGVGSGVTMILLMIKMSGINIKKATSISLGVVTITALVTTVFASMVKPLVPIQHPYTYGLLVLPMILPTAIGCVLFAPTGVNLAKGLSHKTIRLMFVLFLLIAILNMLYNLLRR
jgi:uncharacterized membrane protein YfcA